MTLAFILVVAYCAILIPTLAFDIWRRPHSVGKRTWSRRAVIVVYGPMFFAICLMLALWEGASSWWGEMAERWTDLSDLW